MKKLLNTRIKKLWFYWFIFYIAFVSLSIITIIFTTTNSIGSDIFFGFTAITLLIMVFVYISNKKNVHKERKNKKINIDDNVLFDYFPKGYKLNKDSFKKVVAKRYWYVGTYGVITSIINFLISLTFMYV